MVAEEDTIRFRMGRALGQGLDREIRSSLSRGNYEATRAGLKQLLRSYVRSVENCSSKQGASISPVGSTEGGGK